jgi:hypothetical protein
VREAGDRFAGAYAGALEAGAGALEAGAGALEAGGDRPWRPPMTSPLAGS